MLELRPALALGWYRMTKPRVPIELIFEDLVGGGAAAAKEAAAVMPVVEHETGGDLVSSIQGIMERADTFITNIKELLAMAKGFNQGQQQGPGPGLGQNQPYTPQPTLMQQVHRAVNILYTAYGDITIAELLQTLVAQHGGRKLSTVLKALEKLQ